MELNITIEVWQREHWFVAKCPELDFVSQGETRGKAKENLLEVIRIQFEEMDELGTLDEYLTECGYIQTEGALIPQIEMVSLEKYSVNILLKSLWPLCLS